MTANSTPASVATVIAEPEPIELDWSSTALLIMSNTYLIEIRIARFLYLDEILPASAGPRDVRVQPGLRT